MTGFVRRLVSMASHVRGRVSRTGLVRCTLGLRGLWLAVVSGLVLVGCRGGAAARAAPLPQPQNMAQWLAIAVFVIGIWWLATKITRG
jgi:hypothetical protein